MASPEKAWSRAVVAPTMRLALATAVIPAIILLAPHAAASCCEGGTVCLGTVTVGSGRAHDTTPTLYVDDRNYLQGNGIWLYLESNDKDGLQYGAGCSAVVPNDCEYCYYGDTIPDTLIF